MVLIGVGMQTALYGGSITLMSKFDEDQSEFMATWFAGNIGEMIGHLFLHLFLGSWLSCHICYLNQMN